MIKKVCNILMAIIMVILVSVAGILFVPRLLGYENFAVISGSMEPNIPVGAIVYTKEVAFEDINVGDVISFRISSNTMVTHRVVEIDSDNKQFTTKGDANNVNDGDQVKYQNVVGKVAFTIPLLGYITIYVKTPLGIAGICAILFVIILLNYLPDVFEKKENENE